QGLAWRLEKALRLGSFGQGGLFGQHRPGDEEVLERMARSNGGDLRRGQPAARVPIPGSKAWTLRSRAFGDLASSLGRAEALVRHDDRLEAPREPRAR